MTRQRLVKEETGTVIHSELILPSLKEDDFSTYGCFAQNKVGTDYRMVDLVMEQDTGWISLVIGINTIVGLVVILIILVWHYRKTPAPEVTFPRDRAVLPPIYKGEDVAMLDDIILNSGMIEEYTAINNQNFHNIKNEEKIDLRVVK